GSEKSGVITAPFESPLVRPAGKSAFGSGRPVGEGNDARQRNEWSASDEEREKFEDDLPFLARRCSLFLVASFSLDVGRRQTAGGRTRANQFVKKHERKGAK